MAVFRRRQFSAEKGICHMSETTISTLPDPSGFSPDPLTDLIREGARKLIEQAVEAELATLLEVLEEIVQLETPPLPNRERPIWQFIPSRSRHRQPHGGKRPKCRRYAHRV